MLDITDPFPLLLSFATRGTHDPGGADAMSPSFESNLKTALRFSGFSEETDVGANNTTPFCL